MTNIIKDLGRRPAGAQGNKIRFYLLECTNPTCKTQYEQNASNMKRSKNGLCYECSNKLKNKSKQLECSNNFVKKAIDIHGDLYSYSKVSYVAAIESVINCILLKQ